MILQMDTQERPRDVSGVELLMNNHQSLKAEIDARDENFSICVNLGKDLLARKHYRSPEVCAVYTLFIPIWSFFSRPKDNDLREEKKRQAIFKKYC